MFSLVADYIRAAAVRAGVIKADDKRQFGSHNFRTSLATSLISWGVDFKTVQGTLRHANPQTTLHIYAQVVDANKLAAQGLMYDAVWNTAPEIVQ